MKRILFLLLVPLFIKAQMQEGYYADFLKNEKNTPVKDALIKNLRTGVLVSSDFTGFFQIFAKRGDTISIYYNKQSLFVIVTENVLNPYLNRNLSPIITIVAPIISSDYETKIHREKLTDFSDSVYRGIVSDFNLKQPFYGSTIKKIKEKNKNAEIKPLKPTQIYFSGVYSISGEGIYSNKKPALQQTFVQGSSENGFETWHGPETGDFFSYGPNAEKLEFDGSSYFYDANGRLVAKGMGNGLSTNIYNNSVLRNGSSIKQSIHISSTVKENGINLLKLSLSVSDNRTNIIVQGNNAINRSLSSSLEFTKKKISIKGNFRKGYDWFSNANRIAFLNRVFQQSIITPISFSNYQKREFLSKQVSFSSTSDNAFFLLENRDYSKQFENLAGLIIDVKLNNLNLSSSLSSEDNNQNNKESYKPSTIGFNDGLNIERNKRDKTLNLKTDLVGVWRDYNRNNQEFRFTHFFKQASTAIFYTGIKDYKYQRTSSDFICSYEIEHFTQNNFIFSGKVYNKFYLSNTTQKSFFFLPTIEAYCKENRLFNQSSFSLKLYSSISEFVSEPSIQQSLAYTDLINFSPSEFQHYFPIREVENFNGLEAIRHKNRKIGIELNYQYKFSFRSELVYNKTLNDFSPFFNGNLLQLQNTVNHTYKAVEVQLGYNNNYNKKIKSTTNLSFLSYRTMVTDISDNYNYRAIAGFNSVFNALVKGQPLDIIVGNSYLKNARGEKIIDDNGFPIANNLPTVIGNPNSNFEIKLEENITWKKLSLLLIAEWKNGGSIWNGTKAVLDYYGRSQYTADARRISSYVFDGVTLNGEKNIKPVDFYNTKLPVQQNRWVRYGYAGVAENYIEKADNIRISTISINYDFTLKKYLQKIRLGAYVNNLIIWSAYSGVDPTQPFANTYGLDFFKLPSTKKVGITLSIQF